jgi:hypothetical protein
MTISSAPQTATQTVVPGFLHQCIPIAQPIRNLFLTLKPNGSFSVSALRGYFFGRDSGGTIRSIQIDDASVVVIGTCSDLALHFREKTRAPCGKS